MLKFKLSFIWTTYVIRLKPDTRLCIYHVYIASLLSSGKQDFKPIWENTFLSAILIAVLHSKKKLEENI